MFNESSLIQLFPLPVHLSLSPAVRVCRCVHISVYRVHTYNVRVRMNGAAGRRGTSLVSGLRDLTTTCLIFPRAPREPLEYRWDRRGRTSCRNEQLEGQRSIRGRKGGAGERDEEKQGQRETGLPRGRVPPVDGRRRKRRGKGWQRGDGDEDCTVNSAVILQFLYFHLVLVLANVKHLLLFGETFNVKLIWKIVSHA